MVNYENTHKNSSSLTPEASRPSSHLSALPLHEALLTPPISSIIKIQTQKHNFKINQTTTINDQEKKKSNPWLHALRSEEEEQRWRCGGAKTISPLSMRVCVCLNFEDNYTKKASKIMESSITERAREFMESSRKIKK